MNGAGQKIGIVIDTFPASSDLTLFWQANGIAQSLNNIEEVQVVSGTLPSPSGEETLDVEWSSGMAPGAKVRVYATTDLGFVSSRPSVPGYHQRSAFPTHPAPSLAQLWPGRNLRIHNPNANRCAILRESGGQAGNRFCFLRRRWLQPRA